MQSGYSLILTCDPVTMTMTFKILGGRPYTISLYVFHFFFMTLKTIFPGLCGTCIFDATLFICNLKIEKIAQYILSLLVP